VDEKDSEDREALRGMMLTNWLGESFNLPMGAAAVAVVLAVAWAVSQIAARTIRLAMLRITGSQDVSFGANIVRTPIRVVRLVVFLLIAATLVVPALELSGAQIPAGLSVDTLSRWLLGSGLHIVLIALLTYAVVQISATVVRRLEQQIVRSDGPDALELAKRTRTLGGLVHNVITALVSGIAVLMILQELNINIMPLLTGAGIAGLAVGFGAQTLVRDIISGFFIILENQVRVGDVAEIDGTGGIVEAIGLRTITLRDLSGTVHIFPNGAINKIANMTKDYSYYLIDMGVAYKEDTDKVVAVMRDVADELASDPAFGQSILAPLEVLGVDAFADSSVTIKVRLKTLPLKQWEVGREYRRRIKKAFDARGIEIPFPHLSVYVGEATKPFPIKDLD
jgi:small-conductance mechanosensitive channel